jgi:hypothetical protein
LPGRRERPVAVTVGVPIIDVLVVRIIVRLRLRPWVVIPWIGPLSVRGAVLVLQASIVVVVARATWLRVLGRAIIVRLAWVAGERRCCLARWALAVIVRGRILRLVAVEPLALVARCCIGSCATTEDAERSEKLPIDPYHAFSPAGRHAADPTCDRCAWRIPAGVAEIAQRSPRSRWLRHATITDATARLRGRTAVLAVIVSLIVD